METMLVDIAPRASLQGLGAHISGRHAVEVGYGRGVGAELRLHRWQLPVAPVTRFFSGFVSGVAVESSPTDRVCS
ncbi:hypothetical protein [Actinotalea solisilvae]|uniref:hypothetical protein n=1 Tax=Actinotalea solisilvae TaxID=2072922 RepID=UPI0018F12987|nr:hypothetical protein [Actinotalea solisilvae]